MKILKTILRKPLRTICNLFILAAPLAIVQPFCGLVFGEPECPEILKNSISNK